jgi:hypothetical protein
MSKRIENYLEDRKTLVEEALKKFMPEPSGLAGDVISAMNYSLCWRKKDQAYSMYSWGRGSRRIF